MSRHSFVLILDLLSVLLFTGPIFGWTALYDILLQEGFYSYLCDDANPVPCNAQETALNRAFTFASTAVSLYAFPGGAILDRFGPFRSTVCAGLIVTFSLAGMALCELIHSLTNFDMFLWSLVGLGIGGAQTMMCAYSIAFLFPDRKSLLLGLTSVLFDGSCLVFPVSRIIYHSGVSFYLLFWGYTILSALVFVLLAFAWKLNMTEMTEVLNAAKQLTAGDAQSGATMAAKPIRQQLLSLEFFAILGFASVQVTRSNLFLGTVEFVNRQIAESTGSSANLASISTAVSLIIPLGFISIPFLTMSVQKLGIIGTLHVTTLLGIVYNCLQLIPNLYLQLLAALMFVLFRGFLFSIIADYNMDTFGILKMGRIQGVVNSVAGVLNLVQAPLVSWSENHLHGNFHPLLLGGLLASLPIQVPLLCLQLRQRRTNDVQPDHVTRHASFSDFCLTSRPQEIEETMSSPPEAGPAAMSRQLISMQGQSH
eukprot:TRINITY_DN81142_c0_g1_i1.p1 TRINITY_DN81142_c0_g1~~TRINITY_DN81142_c0_g1_i1.p1  ORF type:complete len:481 (-),score=55.95 TRINITY_DN81142_c0_g1_i1:164-1606(-)